MNLLPVTVKKYLDRYSYHKWKIEISDNVIKVKIAVVVPAIEEYENILKLLKSIAATDNKYAEETIFIFVINNFPSSGKKTKDDNLKSLSLLRNIINKNEKTNELNYTLDNKGWNFGVVDCTTPGKELSEKEGGVGLARKIGLDFALSLFNYSETGKNILVCLDADCTIDNNYITGINNAFNRNNISGAVINFAHNIDESNETTPAIICYEIFLRYYVLGLRFADSPYAFHSIGSTIVCDYESYIKTGGMNKQKAAEDFYFLEKLIKNVKVNNINTATVYPSSRKSWRVPFGTGQRVNRFISKDQSEYLLYNPKSFYLLKDWLRVFNNNEILTAGKYLEKAVEIDKELYNFLIKQNFKQSWNKILNNSKNDKHINRQKFLWFDGFRTMKLMHHLRDTIHPVVNMFDALDEIFDQMEITGELKKETGIIPPISVQKEYLKKLRMLN